MNGKEHFARIIEIDMKFLKDKKDMQQSCILRQQHMITLLP